MSSISTEWYGGGKTRQFHPGQQEVIHDPIKSFSVGEHERLIVFHGPTDDGRAPYLYGPMTSGEAYHLRGYMTGSGPKLVRCERVDVEPEALLRAEAVRHGNGWQYVAPFLIPPGDYSGDLRYFPNDRLDVIEFSAAGTVEVFEHGNYGGRHVTLAPGRHNLADYGLGRQVSSLKYHLDEFEIVGSSFGSVRNKREVGHAVAARDTVRADNPHARVAYTRELSAQEQAAFSWNWSVTAGVTVSASVKGSTGALPGGEVTAGIEASLSATTGQERTFAASQEVKASITVELDPGQKTGVELLVQRWEADVDVVQTLKNKRTGAVISRSGTVHCRFSTAIARSV